MKKTLFIIGLLFGIFLPLAHVRSNIAPAETVDAFRIEGSLESHERRTFFFFSNQTFDKQKYLEIDYGKLQNIWIGEYTDPILLSCGPKNDSHSLAFSGNASHIIQIIDWMDFNLYVYDYYPLNTANVTLINTANMTLTFELSGYINMLNYHAESSNSFPLWPTVAILSFYVACIILWSLIRYFKRR